MLQEDFDTILEDICAKDPRYKPDAYRFVIDALFYSQKKFKSSFISSQLLLEGIKELLLKEFGPMTINVLKHWGIQKTDDFGHIVFTLSENKLLKRKHDDSIENFRNVYNFQEVFDRGYQKALQKKIRRMRGI